MLTTKFKFAIIFFFLIILYLYLRHYKKSKPSWCLSKTPKLGITSLSLGKNSFLYPMYKNIRIRLKSIFELQNSHPSLIFIFEF